MAAQVSTHPITSVIADAMKADSVLVQSRAEMDALAEMARLGEAWLEARVQNNRRLCLVIDAKLEVQRRAFRLAERRRRKANITSSERSTGHRTTGADSR